MIKNATNLQAKLEDHLIPYWLYPVHSNCCRVPVIHVRDFYGSVQVYGVAAGPIPILIVELTDANFATLGDVTVWRHVDGIFVFLGRQKHGKDAK